MFQKQCNNLKLVVRKYFKKEVKGLVRWLSKPSRASYTKQAVRQHSCFSSCLWVSALTFLRDEVWSENSRDLTFSFPRCFWPWCLITALESTTMAENF